MSFLTDILETDQNQVSTRSNHHQQQQQQQHTSTSSRKRSRCSTVHGQQTIERNNKMVRTVTKNHKRVRFATDEENQQIPSNYTLDQVDISALWWSPEEHRQCRDICQQKSEFYHSNRQDYVQQFQKVLARCCDYDKPVDLSGATSLANASVRGLEHWIIPSINYQKVRVVGSVLYAQEKMPKTMSPEEREEVLAMRSLRLSRASATMARLMAEGDSLGALDLNLSL